MEKLGGDLAEFGKKRNTDYDFPPPPMLCKLSPVDPMIPKFVQDTHLPNLSEMHLSGKVLYPVPCVRSIVYLRHAEQDARVRGENHLTLACKIAKEPE